MGGHYYQTHNQMWKNGDQFAPAKTTDYPIHPSVSIFLSAQIHYKWCNTESHKKLHKEEPYNLYCHKKKGQCHICPRVSSALIRTSKVDTTNDNMQARQLPKLWGSEASKNPQFRCPVYPATSHKFVGSLLWVTYKECTWWWVYVKPATHLQGLDWCFRNCHNCFHLSEPTQEHRVGNAD